MQRHVETCGYTFLLCLRVYVHAWTPVLRDCRREILRNLDCALYPAHSCLHALLWTSMQPRCSLVNVLTAPANFLRRRARGRVSFLPPYLPSSRSTILSHPFALIIVQRGSSPGKNSIANKILADWSDWENLIPLACLNLAARIERTDKRIEKLLRKCI